MTRENIAKDKDYFRLYLDAEAAINNAHDTLTAALCAMDSVENSIIDKSFDDETISALYGIRSIVRCCRDDLAGALEEEKAAPMSANCE